MSCIIVEFKEGFADEAEPDPIDKEKFMSMLDIKKEENEE